MLQANNGFWLPADYFSLTAQYVDAQSIDGLPAAHACVQRISTTVSMMSPLNAYDEDNNEQDTPGLALRPCSTMSGPRWYKELVEAALVDGNFYAEKVFVNGVLEQLVPIPNAAVNARIHERTGLPVYEIQGKEYGPDRIFHFAWNTIPGVLRGRGAVTMRRQFSESIALQKYGSDAFNGMPPSVVIKSPTNQPMDAAVSTQMASEWADNMTYRRPIFVPKDAEVQVLSFSPEDNEYISALGNDYARITWCFNMVPSDLEVAIGSGTTQQYQNISQALTAFYIRSCMPLMTEVEAVMSEVTGTNLKFTPERVLRVDPASRYDLYEKGIRSGWLTAEDVRKMEKIADA